MTFYIGRGFHSYELQIGKLVFQLRRRNISHNKVGFVYRPRLFNFFIDRHGRWL